MVVFSKLKQRGDTIVEVMAAIAIMGLALGAAFALSNRSFHTAQNTEERTEALALAQGQIEFLRNAGLNNTIGSLIAAYPNSTHPFCFIDGGANAGNAVAADNDYCTTYGPDNPPNPGALPYDISITYCDGSS